MLAVDKIKAHATDMTSPEMFSRPEIEEVRQATIARLLDAEWGAWSSGPNGRTHSSATYMHEYFDQEIDATFVAMVELNEHPVTGITLGMSKFEKDLIDGEEAYTQVGELGVIRFPSALENEGYSSDKISRADLDILKRVLENYRTVEYVISDEFSTALHEARLTGLGQLTVILAQEKQNIRLAEDQDNMKRRRMKPIFHRLLSILTRHKT